MSKRHTRGFTRMLMLAVMLLPLTCPTAGLAQDKQNNAQLQTVSSRHYRIHSNAGRAEIEFVQRYMDMLFQTYQSRFNEFRRRDNSVMDLYFFAERDQYLQFLVSQNLGASSSSGGVFFVNQKNKGLATYLQDSDPEWTLSTLRHEGFHQFAYAFIGPNLPLWVNEGLAVYFGEGIVLRGRIITGVVPGRRLADIRQAIATNRALGFDELIGMTSQQWQNLMDSRSDNGALLYNQSWSMVHFLIHGDNGRYAAAFHQYLKLLSENMESTAAFAKAFGANDQDAFRRRWIQYMTSVEPDALSAALDDLRFQAIGLRLLHQQNHKPTTAHQLKKYLQQGGFHVTFPSHGQGHRLDASDDTLFTYTLPNGQEKPYLMLEPANINLPPRLTAPGLRPEPTVNWVRNDKGELVFRIDFR